MIFVPLLSDGCRLHAKASSLCLACAWLLLSQGAFPAFANATAIDPFEVDANSWISLDHYTDKEARFGKPDAPDQPTIQESAPTSTSEPKPVPAVEQPVAAPLRPLNLPLMPGLGNDFDVQIDTTDEDAKAFAEEEALKLSRPVKLPVMPGATPPAATEMTDIPPVEQDAWKDAKTTARQKNANSPLPFNVRLATLPDENVKAAPGKPIIRPRKKTPIAQPATAAKSQAKAQEKAQNAEASAALTAYRKKQLAAIESDRKTLDALQAAINELGLDKRMEFLSNVNGPVKTPKTPEASKPAP